MSINNVPLTFKFYESSIPSTLFETAIKEKNESLHQLREYIIEFILKLRNGDGDIIHWPETERHKQIDVMVGYIDYHVDAAIGRYMNNDGTIKTQ